MYDYIFMGASLSNMLQALNNNMNNNILIIEKSNVVGGAWSTITNNKSLNIDTGCHLIVPDNNINKNKIIKFFKDKYNIELSTIKSNNLVYETESFKCYGKQGDPIVCKKGWSYLTNKIYNKLLESDNIKIITNTNIIDVCVSDFVKVTCNNNIYLSKKIVIPTYGDIKKIKYNDNFIDFPYENIVNKHLILYLKTSKILFDDEFHAFFDKEPVGIIDRVSIAASKKENIELAPKILDSNIDLILLCRISKNYKNKNIDYTGDLYLDFLKKKNVVSKDTQAINIDMFDYKCCYRNKELRDNIHKNISKIKNIKFLDTFYMGHFMAKLI